MTARFFGKNIVYLYDAGADAPSYQDTMEIFGETCCWTAYDPEISLDNNVTYHCRHRECGPR